MTDFVPRILGFQPITREDVIQRHTRQLSKDLMSSLAILVLGEKYVYKSSNVSFARRSDSLHKHRLLLKPIMVVTTSGYIVSILGPYLSDLKKTTMPAFSNIWSDVFVIDRGFRDAGEVLEDIGIKMEMPSFMQNVAKHTIQTFLE